MTIQQCKYILKIAEYGSFNKAAKELFVAQSSLSVSVKALENELGIKIFERSGNGVYLTEEGAEFARYARQISEQSDFITNRYSDSNMQKRLFISTQHYDFVADIFVRLINRMSEQDYQLSLREMKTYDVVCETESAFSDIGVIAIKGNDQSIMERYLIKKNLSFTPVLKAEPHIYVRKEHPLADKKMLSTVDIKDYPYVSYEQGEHNTSFFTEEITTPYCDKHIEISDRATLMNVLLDTDGYTVGTGIMPSLLNEGRIVSIPFESDDFYIIGYILRSDKKPSELTRVFVSMLEEIGNIN